MLYLLRNAHISRIAPDKRCCYKALRQNSPTPKATHFKQLFSNMKNTECNCINLSKCEFYNIQNWFYA